MGSSFLSVPFDPKAVFGKVRRQSRRATAKPPAWKADRRSPVTVTLTLDTAPREVEPPADLAAALQAAPPAWERWQELSFTHQHECVQAVEEAKKPETRAKRVGEAVRAVGARAPKRR